MPKKILNSSVIAISGSIVEKSIGIISTAVIARILTPSDFGLIAIAVFFYELCSSLGDLGTQKYILRHKSLTHDVFNKTFTFRFLTLNIQVITILITSQFIASFFGSQHLEHILYIYALSLFIKSFQNIYFFKLYVEFKYKDIVKIDILVKFLSSTFGIILAFYLKNFEALVYTQLFSTILLVLRTYIIIDERPGFDFSGLSTNWNFSKWLLFETLIGYIRGKFDTALTASIFDISTLGRYDIARTNGQLPLQTISEPLAPILLSKISSSTDNVDYNNNFLKIIKISSLIFSPIYILLFFNMDIFILFLLGEKWIDTIILFKLFLTMSYFAIFNSVISSYFISKGNLSLFTGLNLCITISYLLLLYFYSITSPKIEYFTLARISFIPIALLISIITLKFLYKTPLSSSIYNIFLYLIISVICYSALVFTDLHNSSLIFRIICVLIFSILYLFIIVLMSFITNDKLIKGHFISVFHKFFR